jgi:hypothetical protein
MIYQLNMNRGETTRAMGFWVNTILILLTSFGGVKESDLVVKTIKWH